MNLIFGWDVDLPRYFVGIEEKLKINRNFHRI